MGNETRRQASINSHKPYIVSVTKRFIVMSLITSILVAFTIGRAARIILLEGPRQALLAPHDSSAMFVRPEHSRETKTLPNPILIEGKEVPRTLYTAKNFDTAIGASTASAYLERSVPSSAPAEKEAESFCKADENGTHQCSRNKNGNVLVQNVEKDSGKEDEEEHLPAGQHLLVDIKNVDGNFLNSEMRLAEAMVNVVNESKLTLLSYHCHKLIPMGVSCVGVLLESHISFHTWPAEGVITLDLFTCGSGELVPVLPIIDRLFAVPIEGETDENHQPQTVWTHKMRGFGDDSGYLYNDVAEFVLERGNLDYKKQIAWTQTPFQRIDIYDSIDARTRSLLDYEKSQLNDGSYQSEHQDFFLPEREIFLDGVLQSTRLGNEAYHEALVQPAMFAHGEPKRVAIIGGGEGATLREVLKHKSVEKVTMVEIDQLMVEFCREHLPEWNSCADIEDSADWCGDDPRADMRYEDGLAWFNNRFGDNKIDSDEFMEEKFDIIIMDALDPQDNIPFADVLYTNTAFMKTLYNSLNDDGIIVMQLGEAPRIASPAEEVSVNAKRAFVMRAFEELGFKSLHVYEEGHCHFRGPWSFSVAMKNLDANTRWYRSATEIDIAIRRNLIKTKSGAPALSSFDGSVMTTYQNPSKSYEVVYCRSEPTPQSCLNYHGKDNKMSAADGRKLYDPIVDRHLQRAGGICDYVSYMSKVGNFFEKLPEEIKNFPCGN